jgi:hypothetical protein
MVGRVRWSDGYNGWMGTMVGRVQWLDGYNGWTGKKAGSHGWTSSLVFRENLVELEEHLGSYVVGSIYEPHASSKGNRLISIGANPVKLRSRALIASRACD